VTRAELELHPRMAKSWQQVAIGTGVAMWSMPGDPCLHLFPPDGTAWSIVDPGVLPDYTPEGIRKKGIK